MVNYASLLPPDTVRDLAMSSTGYRVNRERAAALLKDGFTYWDMYQKAKPWLFIASLAGMGVTSIGYMRRRTKSLETQAFWIAGFVASATGSYLFKPSYPVVGRNEYSPPPESEEGTFVASLDQKVSQYKAKDPKFADNTLKRFVSIPGIDTAWQDTPAMVRALVV